MMVRSAKLKPHCSWICRIPGHPPSHPRFAGELLSSAHDAPICPPAAAAEMSILHG
jgi:hypothetical protein